MRPLILLVLAGFLGSSAAADTSVPTRDALLAEGATLHDVAFHDAEHGWAVGDRGVVLRTSNGGQIWQPMPTPVTCTLRAVAFVDADHGWAVGGSITPYTHASVGVVLKSEDGGRSWQRIDRGILARMRAVRFFSTDHGLAAGDGTPFNPSGVYATDDGGRTWQPLRGNTLRSWAAADFLDEGKAGVVVGLRGATAWIGSRSLTPANGFAERRGRNAIRMLDPSHGWLAGDGALVRTTRDGGRTWSAPPTEVPEVLQSWFDWKAIEARGSHAWVAGSPGSVVLHTPDAGKTWQTQPTPITTPLHAIKFLDERNGWAVGEFGAILATRDGGQTWSAQRKGDHHAALSFVVGTPNQLPAELLATHAIAEGYHTVVLSPLLAEEEQRAAGTVARLHEASIHCGASSLDIGWRLPLEPDDAFLPAEVLRERLAKRIDGDPVALLAKRIARHLLTHRPAAVVVPDSSNAAAGLSDLLTEAAELALEIVHTEPPTEVNLMAWKPTRLLRVGPDTEDHAGGSRIATGDFSPLLGESPAGWARSAWGLLTPSHRVGPSAYQWRVVSGQPRQADATNVQRRDLLAGLGIARGSVTRCRTSVLPAGRLDQLRRVAQKRRNMEGLLTQAAGAPAWAGQVVNLTGGLDADAGAELLDQLAEGYRATGRADLAADTLYLLARRYPGHPLADAALVRLIRYYASGERAHAEARASAKDARPATLSNITRNQAEPTVPGGASPATSGTLSPEQRCERAVRLSEYLESTRPDLFADPSLRVAKAAAQRARGFGSNAKRSVLLLSKQAIAEEWRRAARAELWLSKPEGLPPEKPIGTCRSTTRRPKLDGILDEALWSRAEPLPVGEDASDRSLVYFARDSQFLYFAAKVRSRSFQKLPTDQGSLAPRPRDADLREHDRLRIRIDVDRDYQTAFALTVDHRGWTHDALWGDRHWRPTWYVAAKEDAESWRIEVAIPLAELADPATLDHAAWAVSIDHLRADAPATHWAPAPSASNSPDAFGLLLME